MTVTTEVEDKKVESQNSKDTEQVNEAQDSSETKSEQNAQDKESQRKKAAMGQIKSYQSKIDDGEITKEDAPAWMQNDLKESPEDLKAQVKAEVLDDLEFEKLQNQLPSDLSEEQTELINKTIQSEMKLGKSKSEALKFATYKADVKLQKVDPRDTHLELTSFPVIKARKTKPKKDEIIKTNSDKVFVEALKQKYGIEIKN